MKKYRPFWHRLNKYNQEYILNQFAHSRMTYKKFMKKYRQPDWCNYYEAIHGIWGCCSLMGSLIHCEDDCCECSENREREKRCEES